MTVTVGSAQAGPLGAAVGVTSDGPAVRVTFSYTANGMPSGVGQNTSPAYMEPAYRKLDQLGTGLAQNWDHQGAAPIPVEVIGRARRVLWDVLKARSEERRVGKECRL